MKRKEHIETGDDIYTPRFCSVTIDEVFENCTDAKSAGYTEPTHYKDSVYGILGKSLDMYHMKFAAYKK